MIINLGKMMGMRDMVQADCKVLSRTYLTQTGGETEVEVDGGRGEVVELIPGYAYLSLLVI